MEPVSLLTAKIQVRNNGGLDQVHQSKNREGVIHELNIPGKANHFCRCIRQCKRKKEVKNDSRV